MPVVIEIVYTNDPFHVEKWVQTHGHEAAFGLDTETRPHFHTGAHAVVSVLQLATPTSVLVVQLNALKRVHRAARPAPDAARPSAVEHDLTPCPKLRALLSGERANTHEQEPVEAHAGAAAAPAAGNRTAAASGISLVSMGARADYTALADACGIPTAGVGKSLHLVDLKVFGKSHGVDVPGGLLGLAQATLGVYKWKSKSLQMSRWDIWPLENRQIIYAAMDAWVSGAIYQRFRRKAVAGSNLSTSVAAAPPVERPRLNLAAVAAAIAAEGDDDL